MPAQTSPAPVTTRRTRTIVAATPRYLTPHQAAQYLGVGHSTLSIHRMKGTGPAYVKWATNIRYDVCTLDAWMESQRVTPVPKPVKRRGRPRKVVAEVA